MGRHHRSHRSGARVLAAVCGLLLLAHPATVAFADDPVAIQGDAIAHAAEGERLFRFLEMATDEAEARAVEGEIWRYWMLAPDEESGQLMAQAMERRHNHDLAGAVEILDQLIVVAPDWAEAWNQRATMRFMQGAFEASLADIEETLEREPRHFGSMAGMALILTHQGRVRQAQSILREAVTIHPFLRERTMIVPLPGKDI